MGQSHAFTSLRIRLEYPLDQECRSRKGTVANNEYLFISILKIMTFKHHFNLKRISVHILSLVCITVLSLKEHTFLLFLV
jgi:hypothetical protein